MKDGAGTRRNHIPHPSLHPIKKYCLDEKCCSMVGSKKPLGSRWRRNIFFQFWSHSYKKGWDELKKSLMSTFWMPKPRTSLWQRGISPQRQIFEIPLPVYHIWLVGLVVIQGLPTFRHNTFVLSCIHADLVKNFEIGPFHTIKVCSETF